MQPERWDHGLKNVHLEILLHLGRGARRCEIRDDGTRFPRVSGAPSLVEETGRCLVSAQGDKFHHSKKARVLGDHLAWGRRIRGRGALGRAGPGGVQAGQPQGRHQAGLEGSARGRELHRGRARARRAACERAWASSAGSGLGRGFTRGQVQPPLY